MESLRIKFIGELPGTPPARTLLLASDTDFCAVCAGLRTDLCASFDGVWIRQKHHFTWLRAFVEHAGLSHLRSVCFSTTTARDLLATRWGFIIPDWLTDEMILAEQLLQRDLSPGTYDSAAAALLAPIIGPISLKFPQTQAGVLAEKASAPPVQAALAASNATKAAWADTLSTWAASKTPSWVPSFCERLRTDPKKLWRDLTVWRLLHAYPQAQQEFALDPAAVSFVREVPVEVLQGMLLNPEGRTLALDQIQPLFEQLRVAVVSRTKLDALLAAVSGELREEFAGLEAILGKDSLKIQRSDVESIARRFQNCPGIDRALLARLHLYVRPPQPVGIDPASADAAAWAKWFHAEYLPYRWWQTEREEADPAVEATVGAFSEWYCREFIHVHSAPALSALQTLSQWRPAILQDAISLILLVDNLPWLFWDSFETALASAGLHKHASQDRFAPLPSHTSVCKPAVVSGRWDVTGCDYRKMLEARSLDEWGGRPVHYLAGVNELNALKNITSPGVFLFNYLAADDALHSDSAAAGVGCGEQLGLLYQRLARAVGEFARRASEGDRAFGLYVITDHGATCILPAEKQSADALLVKRLFPDEKHRSATVTVAQASDIPENLWALGHRFINPCYSDGNVHFIPRGHSTVAPLPPRPIYCHGGATPEEVIVPSGLFRLARAAWVEPNLRFPNLKKKAGRAVFYVKRIANVEVEIQNPNAEEIRLESIVISPAVGDIRDFGRPIVAANAVGQSTVSLYFAHAATTVPSLTFQFTFRIAQENLVRCIELPVSITSAATSGTDLTSLIS